jgi:hypothetical protein
MYSVLWLDAAAAVGGPRCATTNDTRRVNRTTTKDDGHHDDQGQGRGGDAGAEGVPRIASQRIGHRSRIDRETGQPVANWPLVILKELADNALDDAEKTGTAPEIEMIIDDANSVMVADRGSGIAGTDVASLTDYSITTSSNAAYVSPTRGQQGAALQSVLAMPFVLDGKAGEVLIESRSLAHRISFTVDPVRQTPNVSRAKERSAAKTGPASRCAGLSKRAR